MSIINKLFSARGGSPVGGKTKKKEVTAPVVEEKKPSFAKATEGKTEIKKSTVLESKILISSHTAEKALAAQRLNQYVFKVNSDANKVTIMNEVKKNYNVRVLKVNIINIPKKVRRIGRSQGFKAGYKKAIVTLAPGETIEMTK